MAAVELHTSSEIISFARQLENESAAFYRAWSQLSTERRDILLSFAKENEKNVTLIERAYYGVISDALEGCFAFAINPDEYRLQTPLPGDATYSGALAAALEIEEKMRRFYLDAEAQSRSLMADIPRVFRLIASRRSSRQSRLGLLLEQARSQK